MKIDQVWNAFWAGGIANPIEVIEQITYLLFMRGLDEEEQLEEILAGLDVAAERRDTAVLERGPARLSRRASSLPA